LCEPVGQDGFSKTITVSSCNSDEAMPYRTKISTVIYTQSNLNIFAINNNFDKSEIVFCKCLENKSKRVTKRA
jgi:hypothetical protein